MQITHTIPFEFGDTVWFINNEKKVASGTIYKVEATHHKDGETVLMYVRTNPDTFDCAVLSPNEGFESKQALINSL